MEFRIDVVAPLPDPHRLAALLAAEDPAAVAELDEKDRVWRVATTLDSTALVGLLVRAGSAAPSSVKVLPSVCCGGCSG